MLSSQRSDAELIDAIRAGNESALGELVYRYHPRLCTYVELCLSTNSAVEEIVDDIFVNIWRDQAVGVPTHAVASYLYAAARNRAMSELRSSSRRVRRERVFVEDMEWTVHNTADIDRSTIEDDVAAVMRHIDALPDRCREVFVLRWVEHLPYAEIAQILGVSVRTVEKQISIALKKLRGLVND